MKKKIRVRIAVFILLAFFASMIGDRSFARTKDRRDQRILLAAANSIASGKYDEARVLLRTLIYTYPDSPLVQQAKLLIFYSDAREESQRTEDARKILRQVDEYLDRNHPKPRDQ
jgi:outer membrane protein assembly factor BamD (BamD/ComL family)